MEDEIGVSVWAFGGAFSVHLRLIRNDGIFENHSYHLVNFVLGA
jgi:hypothetical protein